MRVCALNARAMHFGRAEVLCVQAVGVSLRNPSRILNQIMEINNGTVTE